MFGWAGRVLRINLTKQRAVVKPLNKAFAKAFLGGRGFNSKVIYDEFDPTITGAYSPENVICVSPGLLTGTCAPSSGRFTVSVARSPVTGVFGDGNAGGHFAPELKYAGYDMIVIDGKADKLSCVWIDDDSVQIKEAPHLSGRTVWETDEMIKEEAGDPETQVLAIGPAGENLVAMANVTCNLTRAVGGCGIGAVFGSKNLKAVAVRGTKSIKVAKPDEFEKAFEESYAHLIAHPVYEAYAKYGTTMLSGVLGSVGALPVRNWQSVVFREVEGQDGPFFVKNYVVKPKGCASCPVHCSHYYIVKEGPYAGTCGEGVEYETINAWGARSGNADLASILHVNNLCNALGLDTISSGSAVCTCMHWWQDGLIDEKDTDGLVLEWGNHEDMIELLKKIANREGFGRILAEGTVQAARKIAKEKGIPKEKLEYYIIHIKGMMQSAVDYRGLKANALQYATATRGADHLRGMPTIEPYAKSWYRAKGPELLNKDLDIPMEIANQWFKLELLDPEKYEGKAQMVKYYQDQVAAIASGLGLCTFVTSWRLGIGPPRAAKLASAATGIHYDWKDILECGDRVYTVEYAILRRYGLGKESDFPPERFFVETIPDGPTKGRILNKEKYEKMLHEYYKIRGYNSNGVPTKEKLEDLGLSDIARDLERRGILKS